MDPAVDGQLKPSVVCSPATPGNYFWRHLIRTVVETFWQNQTFILYIHPDIYSDIHPDYIRTFILNILWNAVWQCSLTFILTCIFHISKQWSWHKFWHLIWEVFCIRYSDMYAFSHLFWHVQISATHEYKCIYIYIYIPVIVYKQLYITSVILPRGIHVQFVPRCSPIRVLGRFSQLRRKQNLIVTSTDPCRNAARHRVATMRFSSKWGMRSYNLLYICIYMYIYMYIIIYICI